MGASAPIVLVMGVATGCFGGLLRDVVSNEVPLVSVKQGKLYVTAALGGGRGALLAAWSLPSRSTGYRLRGVTFALRAGSLAFGWRLPVYKPRPPREINKR
jgi:uncharacterized membrane protein YeiH